MRRRSVCLCSQAHGLHTAMLAVLDFPWPKLLPWEVGELPVVYPGQLFHGRFRIALVAKLGERSDSPVAL